MENYVTPAIAVVEIEIEGAILSASGSGDNGITVTGQNNTGADVLFGD